MTPRLRQAKPRTETGSKRHGSCIPLFARAPSRWYPFQGHGLVFLSTGRCRRLSGGRRFRLDGPGNGHITSALGTLDGETCARVIDYQVLPARSAEKIDVHQSISEATSAIGPNLGPYYPNAAPVASVKLCCAPVS